MSAFSLIGTNLSGGEFGSNVPGTLNTDYTYPTTQELDYYSGKGLKVIRLPFLIERVINSSTNITFRSTSDITSIDNLVSYAATKNLTVLLDPHDYGNWFGTTINTSALYTSFATFWGLLAAHYKSSPNVWFGLMNEPYAQTPAQWFGAINPAIAAIRNAGAKQTITVPGTAYTGAWTWISSGNSAAINPSTVVDPANNYVFEVHQYLDSTGAGTGTAVSSTIGSQRLQAVTQWAQSLNPMPQLFLGECGCANNATDLAALKDMMSYMQANGNVWSGYTYWSGGPWWGAYIYTIEPSGLGTATVTDQPQMGVLTQFIGASNVATGTVTVTAADGGTATTTFTVSTAASDTVTIASVTVTPASAPAGTARTLTIVATSSTGSTLTAGTPVLTGATFTAVAAQPAGTFSWTFTY